MYGVEYYSDYGNGVRYFDSADERDIWLINMNVDNFYLFMKE